jgi:hypothetical protein
VTLVYDKHSEVCLYFALKGWRKQLFSLVSSPPIPLLRKGMPRKFYAPAYLYKVSLSMLVVKEEELKKVTGVLPNPLSQRRWGLGNLFSL